MAQIVIMASVIVLIRNEQVYRFLKFTAEVVYVRSQEDIKKGLPYQWRWDQLKKVDYKTMLYKFYKPLKPENFWEDTSFLKQSNKK